MENDYPTDSYMEVYDLLEDTTAHACDEYGISAPMVYLAMEAFVQAKRTELNYLFNSLNSKQ